jgi:hypothetical protein
MDGKWQTWIVSKPLQLKPKCSQKLHFFLCKCPQLLADRNMSLIATTITLFITNVHVMADEYSGTILQRQPPSSTVLQAWRHTVQYRILHENLKFWMFTYTATLFTATVLLLLMELTEHRTKRTVQQPFTVPTDSVQWKVQWTLCGVGATDWMVAVHNTVIHLVVCG